MIVYIPIGNSDDKLTQAQWSAFVAEIRQWIRHHADRVHGEWFSAPDAEWQNACWCAELNDVDEASKLRRMVGYLRELNDQDSAAWAVVPETEFI